MPANTGAVTRLLRYRRFGGEQTTRFLSAPPQAERTPTLSPAFCFCFIIVIFFSRSRKANVVLEMRQLAMKIFEDYTVSWYWIIM